MRIGVTLPPGDEVGTAVAAESLGVPFVHVAAAAGTEAAIAAAVAVATTTVRILVGVGVGDENPVTLAEEIAVVDNVSNGRLGVIAEIGALDGGGGHRGRRRAAGVVVRAPGCPPWRSMEGPGRSPRARCAAGRDGDAATGAARGAAVGGRGGGAQRGGKRCRCRGSPAHRPTSTARPPWHRHGRS